MNGFGLPGKRGNRPSAIRSLSAFTLLETMITMVLISSVVAAVFVCQYYGLQLYTLIRPKLDSAAFARNALTQMIEEVRSAECLYVGQGSLTNFIVAGSTNAQRGNALRISFEANTNRFICYYQDPVDQTLKKIPLGWTNAMTVAHSVTNRTVFTFRDFSGVILTNNQNNITVDVDLQMIQDTIWPMSAESYQIRTRINRRAIF